mgnify:CR=1 FL=1
MKRYLQVLAVLRNYYTRKQIQTITDLSPSTQRRIERGGDLSPRKRKSFDPVVELVGRKKKKSSVNEALFGKNRRKSRSRFENARRIVDTVYERVGLTLNDTNLPEILEHAHNLLSRYYRRLKERQLINLGLVFKSRMIFFEDDNDVYSVETKGINSVAYSKNGNNMELVFNSFSSKVEELLNGEFENYVHTVVFVIDVYVAMNTPITQGYKNEKKSNKR